MKKKKKILLIGEAVTLAHVTRILALAPLLDSEIFDVELAFDQRFDKILGPISFKRHSIFTISADDFNRASREMTFPYTEVELRKSVDADLQLIKQVKPDLLVGDFRISLGLSARISGIPFVSLTNAYWSPDFALDYPVPYKMHFRSFLGLLSETYPGRLFAHYNFVSLCKVYAQVAKELGVTKAVTDIRHVFGLGDYTLFLDPPDWVPLNPNSQTLSSYVGPLQWNAPVKLPSWWSVLPKEKNSVVYVNLGSSGDHRMVLGIIPHLRKMKIPVILVAPHLKDQNEGLFFTAPFLANQKILPWTRVLICNGGTPSSYQALAESCRIVGMPSNYDQQLNMKVLQHHRVAEEISHFQMQRKDSGDILMNLICKMLEDFELESRVQSISKMFRPQNQSATISKILAELS